MIIHLISSPRTVSTSLMYAFDNRNDTIGIDEPFYGYYLHKTGKDHPGRYDVLAEMPYEPNLVFDQIHKAAINSDHVFVKNMSHHMIDLPLEPFLDFVNIFLIRNPRRIIASFTKVIPSPTLFDIGVAEQWKLYNELIDAGSKVVVVDSGELIKQPEHVIKQICESIDLPFSNSMLQWEAGARPIDGSWANYWYRNTHLSTGFTPVVEKTVELNEYNENLYNEAKNYYNMLFDSSIH